jgi:deoxyhypusine synthase
MMVKKPGLAGKAHENTFHKSVKAVKLPEIHGYDFDQPFDFRQFLASYASTGHQASHLAQAIEMIKEMRKEKEITIYLGYTSNMVSSGLRDVFRYLVKHKMVDVIVTTAGGVEEDIIKCIAPFYLSSFEADGAQLRDQGLNRIGNVLVPNDHYIRFEQWITPILHKMADEETMAGKSITPSEFIDRLGKEIDNEESIYYWAHKNQIPVFCPALVDGSIGDMIYFFLYKRPEFTLDTARDVQKMNDITMTAKKTGLIILGSGVVKHHILNSNMMRNGADYAVYVNNSQEFDGSDAGARPDEAVSWGKILPKAKSIKVFGDATILFPLIVAGAFGKK